VCQEDGTDNFASLRSLDWQAHVYGDASIEIEQACTQAGLSLRRFSWSEAAGKTGIARNAFYLVRPDGYVGFGRRERCRRHASRLPGTLRPRLRQGEAIAAGGRRDPLGPAMTGDLPARPAKAPRPQPLRAEKSAARRAAILKAALDEFCERGFAATRVEDVAARAGVAKGTIYLNFKDKQALFEELIRSTLGAHITRLEAVHLENGQRMRDTVEAILLPMIEAARTGRLGDLMRLMIAESGRFPDLAEFYYHEVLARAMSAIRRLAREAIREGELAGEQLVRFPQIIGAPVVVTLLWTTLFDKFAPLDSRGLLQAYLDLVFGPPAPKEHPKRTRRPGSRRIES
jgi:AcrR family transcriptional regulator